LRPQHAANLSAYRPAVFAESFRVLRSGGRLDVTNYDLSTD
jgi:hypothetical protein